MSRWRLEGFGTGFTPSEQQVEPLRKWFIGEGAEHHRDPDKVTER